ncbi:hypothetical protein GGR53DRAFT_143535 [Hypoxylon sp. FL1150]|nr:hypothetical protein GGR53DRAFT_143535 [Hypoxylon sp. FL1150]
MDRVPPEILLHIFDFLDGTAPSQARLHDQPSYGMLEVEDQLSLRLKSVSLVCKDWRTFVLPSLFRHIQWKPKMSSLRAFTLNPIPLLRFLEDNKLDRSVTTFTLIVDFVDREADARHVTPEIRTVDLEWLWDQLFSVIDPLRFTIIAPPTTLAAFMSRMLFLDDAWSFSIPYHILSLGRTTRGSLNGKSSSYNIEAHLSDLHLSNLEPSTARTSQPAAPPSSSSASCPTRNRKPPACPLFTIRPWTSLLLNEGSFIKVYQTYEFFFRRPPSMLGALLGGEEYPNNTSLIPSTVTDFNYIAIFPLASHFETLLRHLPRVERLFVQLTPGPENQILQNEEEIRHIDMTDLWLERNTAYGSLIRELTLDGDQPGNWAGLRVFESGDAADREAWEMAVQFVERSEVETGAWKVERDGVFVKHDEDGNPPDAKEDVDGHAGAVVSPGGQLLSV